MNFKGQKMCQGRLCWLTSWKVMERREVRKEKIHYRMRQKKWARKRTWWTDHGWLCLSPSSAEQGRENLLKCIFVLSWWCVYVAGFVHTLFTSPQMQLCSHCSQQSSQVTHTSLQFSCQHSLLTWKLPIPSPNYQVPWQTWVGNVESAFRNNSPQHCCFRADIWKCKTCG